MDLKFMKMGKNHLAQIMEIEQVAFTNPWTEKAFLSELVENSFGDYIVCLKQEITDWENKEELIGYAGMWIILDELHITTISVRENYQGNRVGELLLQHLFIAGRAKGAINATLEVRPSNIPALRLYERLGFKPCGIRKKYYNDNGEDAIIMWKDL